MTIRERGALDPEAAAEYLMLSRAKVYDLIRGGELRSFKIGKSRRVRLETLEAWMKEREAAEAA